MGAGTLIFQVTADFDISSVAANTTEEQTVTVTGAQVGDAVIAEKPSHEAGLNVGNARVSAADTVAVQFGNPTASPIDPSSETWTFTLIRNF